VGHLPRSERNPFWGQQTQALTYIPAKPPMPGEEVMDEIDPAGRLAGIRQF
jgi:hypothetical protein